MSDPADPRDNSRDAGRGDPLEGPETGATALPRSDEPVAAGPQHDRPARAGEPVDIAAQVRRAAAANLKWSLLFSVAGFALALTLLVLALRAPGFQVVFALLMLFLFGFRAYQSFRVRRLREVTSVTDGVLESVGRDGYLVESGGVRLKLRVMRPRGSRFTVTPGQAVRVTQPFVAGYPVAIVFPGPADVEGLLAMPIAPARGVTD